MASRLAQHQAGTVPREGLHYTGANVFPDQQREQPNSKEITEYWSEINGILDGHEFFGYMERGVTPPSFAKFDLVDESGILRCCLCLARTARRTPRSCDTIWA